MTTLLVVRIKNVRGEARHAEYKNEINFHDYKQLATFLLDLEVYGADVNKAIEEFKKRKAEKFPW